MRDVKSMVPALPDLLIEPIIHAALAEDLGRAGDVTAAACIAPYASRNVSWFHAD